MLFDWSPQKNEWLRTVRGISFDDIVFHLQTGGLLDILEHQRPGRYRCQRVLVVDVDGYAYVAPFVMDEQTYFLKTIFPSRKMTRKYLGASRHETD